jgi:hypothetical protein
MSVPQSTYLTAITSYVFKISLTGDLIFGSLQCFCFDTRNPFNKIYSLKTARDLLVPLVRGDAVGSRTALQAGRSRVRFPMGSSDRTMALELTQPLTTMSTSNISWGKCGRYVGLTNLPPTCADCRETWDCSTFTGH